MVALITVSNILNIPCFFLEGDYIYERGKEGGDVLLGDGVLLFEDEVLLGDGGVCYLGDDHHI